MSSGGRAAGAPASRQQAPVVTARVAVIQRRGKFLVAEPFFGPGPMFAVSRDRRISVGDLVVVRPGPGRHGRGAGRAVVARTLGRPGVARDVIEALMVDRGLRRCFDPAVEREARTSAQAVPARTSPPGRILRHSAGVSTTQSSEGRADHWPLRSFRSLLLVSAGARVCSTWLGD